MPEKIRLLMILQLALCLLSNAAVADSDTFSVVQITDTHLCKLEGYDPEFVKRRQSFGNGITPLRAFLETVIQRTAAEAVVITGDLIDYYEAETAAGHLRAAQIEQWLPLAQGCPVPLFLTLGNHDLTSYWFQESENTIRSSQDQARQARAAWIRNLSCFRQGTYYVRTFNAGPTRYRFLFLDNGYSLTNGDIIDPIQLDWLNYQLDLAGSDPVVLFMHRYLAVPDLNGDGSTFSSKPDVTVDQTTCSKGFLKSLNDHSNVKALFVGHGHKNVSEWIPFPGGHRILQTETAAFAAGPQNWRLLEFTEDRIRVHFPGGTRIELTCPIR